MKLKRIITAALMLSFVGSAATVPDPIPMPRVAQTRATKTWRPALPVSHVVRPEIVRHGQPWLEQREPGQDHSELFNRWMVAVFERHLFLMRKLFQANQTDRWCKGLWRLECWTLENARQWCWILGNGYCLEDDIKWANERGTTAAEWWKRYAGHEAGLVLALGWTGFTDHASTVHYYASSSLGSSGNDGLSDTTPKDTIAHAVALAVNGTAYVIHLKAGDTFPEQVTLNGKDGYDADNPAVFTTYGTGARPIISTSTDNAFYVYTTNGQPSNGYLFFKNIDATSQTPGSGTGFFCFNKKTHVTLEGCRFRRFLNGIYISQLDSSQRPSNVLIRRCVWDHNDNMGLLVGECDGIMVRECVMDHNGWTGGDTGHGQKHNTYLQIDNTDAAMIECVSGRASFAGCSVRCFGLQYGNVGLKNPMNIGMGHASATNAGGYCGFCVSHRSRNINSSEPIGWGVAVEKCGGGIELEALLIKENSSSTGNVIGLFINDSADIDLHHTVIYQWHEIGFAYGGGFNFNSGNTGTRSIHDCIVEQGAGGCFSGTYTGWTFANNTWFSTNSAPNFISSGMSYATFIAATGETSPSQTQPVFSDDSRTIDTYLTSIGETGDEDDFMDMCVLQQESDWNYDLTAIAVGDYLRAGHDMQLAGVADLAVSLVDDDATLSATASGNPYLTGYGVERRKDGGAWATVATGATLPYADNNLSAGVYDYRLLVEYDTGSFGGVGEQFPYSNVDSGTVGGGGGGPPEPVIGCFGIAGLNIGVQS